MKTSRLVVCCVGMSQRFHAMTADRALCDEAPDQNAVLSSKYGASQFFVDGAAEILMQLCPRPDASLSPSRCIFVPVCYRFVPVCHSFVPVCHSFVPVLRGAGV